MADQLTQEVVPPGQLAMHLFRPAKYHRTGVPFELLIVDTRTDPQQRVTIPMNVEMVTGLIEGLKQQLANHVLNRPGDK